MSYSIYSAGLQIQTFHIRYSQLTTNACVFHTICFILYFFTLSEHFVSSSVFLFLPRGVFFSVFITSQEKIWT